MHVRMGRLKTRSSNPTQLPPVTGDEHLVLSFPASSEMTSFPSEETSQSGDSSEPTKEIPEDPIPSPIGSSEETQVMLYDKTNECFYPIQQRADDITPQYDHDKIVLNDMSKRVPSTPSFNVGSVTVKAEELGLVLVVLFLWAGAISLFINRWGKLRMLEPYQPAYTAPVTPPPRTSNQAPFININIQSTSSVSLNDPPIHKGSPTGGGAVGGGSFEWTSYLTDGYVRDNCREMGGTQSMNLGMPRSPSCLSIHTLNSQRKVRSAVDLVSLVMQEKLSSTNGGFTATNV